MEVLIVNPRKYSYLDSSSIHCTEYKIRRQISLWPLYWCKTPLKQLVINSKIKSEDIEELCVMKKKFSFFEILSYINEKLKKQRLRDYE